MKKFYLVDKSRNPYMDPTKLEVMEYVPNGHPTFSFDSLLEAKDMKEPLQKLLEGMRQNWLSEKAKLS